MSKGKEVSGITVRFPFQLEYKVSMQIAEGGKVVDTACVTDRIMESGFNGTTIEQLVKSAYTAAQKKAAEASKGGP